MRLRAAVGRAAGRVFPQLHQYAFDRDRNRALPHTKVRLKQTQVPAFRQRPFHLVVAALEGPGCDSWGPAHGNYYYEIYQSARELFGGENVSVLDIAPDGSPDWGLRLAELLRDSEATHLIAHMERDPGLEVRWTWDEVWADIAQWWDGTFVGVMWDSGFDLIRMKGRRLARMSPNLLGLDICVPIDGALVRGRPEVGPVPLLESRETQALLADRLQGVQKTSDLSFIGALYPYRQELLDSLAANGLRVTVNPHKQSYGDTGSAALPSWLDYMAVLASSEMTLNFSMASSGAHKQLKWRVIEASLAGTLLVTDDMNRTREFFVPSEEFATFRDARDLARTVEWWLARPDELRATQERGQRRAQYLATFGFWSLVGRGLERRGLPRIPDISAGSQRKAQT